MRSKYCYLCALQPTYLLYFVPILRYKKIERNTVLIIENSRVEDTGNYSCTIKARGFKTVRKKFCVSNFLSSMNRQSRMLKFDWPSLTEGRFNFGHRSG